MSLIELAVEAYSNRCRSQEEAEAERAAAGARITEQNFERTFGVKPKKVDGGIVEHEGMVLRFGKGNMATAFELRGVCQNCGEQTWSRDITGPADLGKYLADFAPQWSHVCEKPEEPEEPTDIEQATNTAKQALANYRNDIAITVVLAEFLPIIATELRRIADVLESR